VSTLGGDGPIPVGLGGGGASLPVADPADLLSGATASRLVGTDVSGDGTLLTAAQGRTLLGVDAARSNAPDLTTGTYTGGTNVSAVVTSSTITATIVSGATNGDGAQVVLTPPTDSGAELEITFRAVHAHSGAGNQVAKLLVTLGGAATGTSWSLVNDEGGNTTMDAGWPGTPRGNVPGARTTTWVRVRISALGVTVSVSADGNFKGPFYAYAGATVLVNNASAPATIASITLRAEHRNSAANATSTLTIDNVTVRRL